MLEIVEPRGCSDRKKAAGMMIAVSCDHVPAMKVELYYSIRLAVSFSLQPQMARSGGCAAGSFLPRHPQLRAMVAPKPCETERRQTGDIKRDDRRLP